MNYWYAARPDEIFLDLDSAAQVRRALRVIRLAWSGAGKSTRALNISKVFLYLSRTPGHVHIVIELARAGRDFSWKVFKTEWALWMAGDPLRAVYALERARCGLRYEELLVSEKQYHRRPDAQCSCRGKHKDQSVTRRCPALRLLLGAHHAAADYFPRVRDERKKLGRLMVPVGRIAKRRLIRWENPRWAKDKIFSI